MKPVGISLLLVGGLYFAVAVAVYPSGADETTNRFIRNYQLIVMTVYGFAAVIAGVTLLRSAPKWFLRLNRIGLTVFVILAAILPVLCWIPWVTPGLRTLRAGYNSVSVETTK